MSNCSNCNNEKTAPEAVPYIVHESAMARAERGAKRLWTVIILLIVLLVGTNGAWRWDESQFEVMETTTIEAEQDGSGVNIVGGGNVDYGAEGKDNKN